MYNKFMNEALMEAIKDKNEVPVGAVLVVGDEIIARAHNRVENKNNALLHCEMLVINEGIKNSSNKYLENATLYVTKEPCIMCFGAVCNARIKSVYFGAYDVKFGGMDFLLSLSHHKKINHYTEIYGGIMENECKKLLGDFFRCC